MNPDEQDRNPFRRRTSASSRTGRYLSGRPNFSQQQTPDFFSQAMAQNTPAPTQKNRVNKKPIFITLGILGIIAFIVLTATVIIPMIGDVIADKDKNHSFLELQATIAEYREDLVNMRITISSAAKDVTVWSPLYKNESRAEAVSVRNKISARIKEFKTKLDNFGGIKAYSYFNQTIDVDPQLDYIKNEIDVYLSAFDKIKDLYAKIVEIYDSEGDKSKIEALRNEYNEKEIKDLADDIEEYYKVYAKYANNPKFSECIDINSTKCEIDLNEFEKAHMKLMNSTNLRKYTNKVANEVLEREQEQNVINAVNEVYNLHNEKVVHE